MSCGRGHKKISTSSLINKMNVWEAGNIHNYATIDVGDVVCYITQISELTLNIIPMPFVEAIWSNEAPICVCLFVCVCVCVCE